jgi:hypothetical protein
VRFFLIFRDSVSFFRPGRQEAALITSSAGSGPCANRLAASPTQEIHPIIAVTGCAAEGSARSTIATIGTQRIFGGHVHSQMEKLIAPERCWSRMTPQGRSVRTVTNVESLQLITGVTPYQSLSRFIAAMRGSLNSTTPRPTYP